MKKLLAFAVLCVVTAAAYAAPEAVSLGGAAAFERAPGDMRVMIEAQAQPLGPVLQPELKPKTIGIKAVGEEVARVNLAAQYEKNLHLMNQKFGSKNKDLGVATDAAFKSFYLSFLDASGTTLGALGDLNRLRGEGVNVRIDGSTVYNFKVAANIFDPVRGSTFKETPVQGTNGPSYSMKTGVVVDEVQAHSAVFTAGGNEYWMFYGRDVNDAGTGFADTRSFLFIHMDGLSSKAYPLAESKLTIDAQASVDLGGTTVLLTRTASGELVIGQ